MPRRWILAAFGTLLAFGASPSSVPTARYLGINGRVGYRLPVDLGSTEWFFLGGWYLWTMYTPDGSYGVNALSGTAR